MSKWTNTKNRITVLNDPLSQVQNCMHDIIQVFQLYAAYCKKWYTCILLKLWCELSNLLSVLYEKSNLGLVVSKCPTWCPCLFSTTEFFCSNSSVPLNACVNKDFARKNVRVREREMKNTFLRFSVNRRSEFFFHSV